MSYSKIKKIPSLNVHQKAEDMAATLILIATHKRLLSFSFYPEQIDDFKYFRTLRDIILTISIKEPFVTVLVEGQIHKIVNWR